MFNVKKAFSFFIYFLLVISFFEFISRYGHRLFFYEDHQKYGYTYSHHIDGNIFKLKINGRSSIGKSYQGEPIQIGFFGTSTLFHGVSPDKNWPELVRKSDTRIHIDNFGMYNESTQTLNAKLNNLCFLKSKYNFIVIQLSHLQKEPVPTYNNKFKPRKSNIQFYQRAKEWYKNTNEAIINPIGVKPYFFGQDLEVFLIQNNLQLSLLKQLFVSYDYKINTDIINSESKIISDIINKAHCISKSIFWITEPIAWSANMLESYYNLPLYMRNINQKSEGLVFLNHRSYASYMLQQKNIIESILLKKKVLFL